MITTKIRQIPAIIAENLFGSMPYINNLVDEFYPDETELKKLIIEKVEGSDRPVLVIKGTFNGLGPVALASKAE